MAVSPRQARAIAALLEGKSQEQAAAAAGVTSRTLRRWMDDRENRTFSDTLRQAEGEHISATMRRLLVLSDMAISTLAAGMRGNAAGPAIRAADLSLAHLARLRELHELEARVAELERLAHERNNRQPSRPGSRHAGTGS